VVRLDLFRINYIESLGDYIKIYCTDEVKPILSLCSMKSIEEVLPEDDFIRVHRSYIVRKERIIEIKKGHIVFNSVNIPIGDSYRKKFQNYIDNLPIL
jgi:two-component system, LytTR family, response regulator